MDACVGVCAQVRTNHDCAQSLAAPRTECAQRYCSRLAPPMASGLHRAAHKQAATPAAVGLACSMAGAVSCVSVCLPMRVHLQAAQLAAILSAWPSMALVVAWTCTARASASLKDSSALGTDLGSACTGMRSNRMSSHSMEHRAAPCSRDAEAAAAAIDACTMPPLACRYGCHGDCVPCCSCTSSFATSRSCHSAPCNSKQRRAAASSACCADAAMRGRGADH